MFTKKTLTDEEAIRKNEEWLNGGFERHEARVLAVCIPIALAISLGVWYLSVTHIGYWWTVFLAEILGQ
jgi:hypothetical protein